MKTLFLLAALPWAASGGGLPGSTCDITAYGARSDQRTNAAAANQKAIRACAQAGGGTVYFPAGNYLSGAIVLESNVTLHLSPGATLWGSRNFADYTPKPHLIYAADAENIGIEGAGTINGNGDAFWNPDFTPKQNRPSPFIRFNRCRNVRIRDVRIRNTPALGIYPLECDGVSIKGISMISTMRGPNTDGIDISSSRNVVISDSYIETGDDAICLKSQERMPTENVTVTNCVLTTDDSAIKVGTATHSNFKNCTFSNCVISGSREGISMYVKDGGRVEGLTFANIRIDTSQEYYVRSTGFQRDWIEYPIFIDLERRTPQSKLSRIRDINFSDIQIETKGRILIAGMAEQPLENFTFRNVAMRITGVEAIDELHKPRGIHGMAPASREQDYSAVRAAIAFVHMRGLNLRDVRVIWDTAGAVNDRHAIYASDVHDLFVGGFNGSPLGSTLAAIGLDGVRRAFISQSQTVPGTVALIGLNETLEAELVLDGNNLGKVWPLKQGRTYVHLPK